jgi:hypothetical protein
MASTGSDGAFKAQLSCRSDGAFVGTVDIYHAAALADLELVATLTCSDTSKHAKQVVTMNISDWDFDSPLSDAFVVEMSSSGLPFGGCGWAGPVALLENPGREGRFVCRESTEDGKKVRGNEMSLKLFSVGDQPS